MNFKCVVIDDEQHAIDALVGYIEKMPQLLFYRSYTDPLKALAELGKKDKIDFLFIDVEMPGITGIALAAQLRSYCRFLIFTTGHSNYALNAFEVKANQFLLKPISFAKFTTAIDGLIRDQEHLHVTAAERKQLQFIKADQKNTYHHLDEATITAIEADRNSVSIYTLPDKEVYNVHMGLNQIEGALGTDDFIRINKSTIIAKKQIKSIEGSMVKLKDGRVYKVGITFRNTFTAFLQQHILKNSLNG